MEMSDLKKTIAIILMLLFVCVIFTGCNKQLIDTTYSFNYAIIRLQDGSIIEGRVQSWKDFEDGDQLQVKIDSVTYLVHSMNCTLMNR